jgi:non-specific protein-tyrosine kinase
MSEEWQMEQAELVTLRDPRSPAAEAYRALHANLKFASIDQSLNSMVVAPPDVAGLEDDVAANLAVVMAQTGQRVILIDADLRRPRLHDLFGIAQEPGVTDVVLSRDDEMDIPISSTEVEGLRVIASGALPPNPADILGSQSMEGLLDRLQTEADVVIFTAPPVTVAVDASVLAAQTDGLMLVVRAGHTRRDRIEQAKEQLKRFRARLLGAVMTNAPKQGRLTGY